MKKIPIYLFCLALSSLNIGAAGAAILTFDDITSDAEAAIDNGYGDLNWANFWVQDPLSALDPFSFDSGFYNGVVSGNYSAFNAGGNSAEITSSTPFDFTSAYFAAAYRWGMSITATGFLNGSQVAEQQFTVNTDAASFVALNFTGIDRVTFLASGGDATDLGDGFHFTLDNANVTTVPVPTAAWLFGSAVAGFMGLKRRKA